MVAASSCGLNRVGGTRVAHRVAVGSYTVWPLGALGPLEAWGGACWTPCQSRPSVKMSPPAQLGLCGSWGGGGTRVVTALQTAFVAFVTNGVFHVPGS